MNLNRIMALVKRDSAIMNRSRWRWVEMFYLPISSLFIWGFFSVFARTFAVQLAFTILIVQIFFEFAYLAQGTANQQMMEDVWTGSFRDLMLTPLTPMEYLLSRIVHSALRSLLTLAILMGGAFFLFGANLIAENIVFFLGLAVLTFFASATLAIIVASLILSLGREYGFLSWSSIQVFILLSAPFYPITVFPGALQYVSYVMPYTWIFESIKNFVATNEICYSCITYSLISNLTYLAISLPLFIYSFNRAIKTGALARFWR